MKLTLLSALGSLAVAIAASAPSPSNTNIQINNARIPITKSGVTSHLNQRETDKTHDALHYLSNAIRDASTDAVQAKSGMRGIRRRAPKPSNAQLRSTEHPAEERSMEVKFSRRSSMGKTRQQSRRAPKSSNAQLRSTELPAKERSTGEAESSRRSGMGKTRRQSRHAPKPSNAQLRSTKLQAKERSMEVKFSRRSSMGKTLQQSRRAKQ